MSTGSFRIIMMSVRATEERRISRVLITSYAEVVFFFSHGHVGVLGNSHFICKALSRGVLCDICCIFCRDRSTDDSIFSFEIATARPAAIWTVGVPRIHAAFFDTLDCFGFLVSAILALWAGDTARVLDIGNETVWM